MRNGVLRLRDYLMFFASELRSVGIFLGIEKGSNSCWTL